MTFSMTKATQVRPVEWPTVALTAGVYLAFAVTTVWLEAISLPLAILATSVILAQYSSLQHEVLHGHPFRWQWLNALMVFPGLTLFVPFGRFRDTHLAHHHDERLTDPYEDPESNYLDPAAWERLPLPLKMVFRLNNVLLGRMVIGPLIGLYAFYRKDIRLVRSGDGAVLAAWLGHFAGVALLILWLVNMTGMPLWAYGVAAYLSNSWLRIRTFLEHQANERASGRTVVIESRGILAFLFLNNNFHVVHHMHPKVAWYRLPGLYAENRAHYLHRNGGYVFRNYAQIFRQFLLTPKDPVPHPLWKRASGSGEG